jgi:hypothetical protein
MEAKQITWRPTSMLGAQNEAAHASVVHRPPLGVHTTAAEAKALASGRLHGRRPLRLHLVVPKKLGGRSSYSSLVISPAAYLRCNSCNGDCICR